MLAETHSFYKGRPLTGSSPAPVGCRCGRSDIGSDETACKPFNGLSWDTEQKRFWKKNLKAVYLWRHTLRYITLVTLH